MKCQLVAFLGLSSVVTVFSSFFAVRQDGNGVGHVASMNTFTGDIAKESNDTNFQFSWPLVEMTTDRTHNNIYIITYPASYPGPVLYKLNSNLEQTHAWTNVDYSFFDLQYASQQNTLYGIKVTSTYGRVLSNFVVDEKTDSVVATEMYTLPYMWYVNASTYNDPKMQYIGLINYFPGHPESTLDQQLVTLDCSVSGGVGEVIPLSRGSMGIVQFITYSVHLNGLLYLSMSNPFESDNVIHLGLYSLINKASAKVYYELIGGYAIGPMTYDEAKNTVYYFMKETKESSWGLYSIDLNKNGGGHAPTNRIRTYEGEDYHVFAAASKGF